jgi:hypothetical protein
MKVDECTQEVCMVVKRRLVRIVAFAVVFGLLGPSFALARGEYRAEPLGSFAADNAPSAGDETGVQVLESSAEGIVLELTTSEFAVEPGTADDGPCDRVSVAGYGETDTPGWPRLPVQGTIVGIPLQADMSLTVLETEATEVPGRFDLCPVPQPIIDTDLSGSVTPLGEVASKSTEAYASGARYPTSEAEVVSTGFIRSQRVAHLQFHPFQYIPASGALYHVQRIRVRLDFGGLYPDGPVGDEGPFENVLRDTLVNYDAARGWRTQPVSLDRLDALSGQTGPSYKVLVDRDGIYEIAYGDLQAAGIEAATLDALDPRTFQMRDPGQEVAIYVAGEEDGSFDAADYILFYGQKIDTKYTDVNVYWLTWGGAGGRRMAQVDGTPTGSAAVASDFQTVQHIEEDHSYFSDHASGPDADHWYWNYIYTSGSPASNSYVATLPHVATAPYSATVRGLLKGYQATPAHHTQVYLNGHLIDEAVWASTSAYAFEVDVPHTYLADGANTLTLTGGVDNAKDVILVNRLEIEYRAPFVAGADQFPFGGDWAGTWEYQVGGLASDSVDVFDVTAAASPARVLGGTVEGSGTYTLTFQHAVAGPHDYLAATPAQRLTPAGIARDAASDLRSPANGADYIIITHADFYTSMLTLADHRAGQGLRTMVVDVQDVYDEFSYGVFEPEAIRDFLAYAYSSWTAPAPTYVLLAGDGNYDFKDHLGRGEPNYIPPYLASIDLWMGEVAADNRYVCVSGDDVFPDMHLGRLPVKTGAEAASVVDRIIDYEENPASGDWNSQVLFVADDPDSAGDFYAYSDAVADTYVPAHYTTQKVYYGLTHPSSSAAKAAIADAIDAGRLIVNYAGHASTQSWAGEKLFGLDSIPALSNGDRLPLLVAMACLDGYYIHPSDASRDRSSTAEALVRTPGKGAIAAWSSTGMGLASTHDYLNRGLFEAIFTDDVVELGPATTQGKLYLHSRTSGYGDQIDEFTLFGDPALRLNVARADRATSASGNWHAASTWSDGFVPAAGDVVTITAGTAVTVDADAQAYRLVVESGGTLEIPDGVTLRVTDGLVNHGTLRQTRDISGSSDVAFLDAGGYGGVTVNANGQALGSTVVEIKGQQDCAGTDDEVVARCFEITPTNTSALDATVTFYFDGSELLEGGQCGDDLGVSHYHGGAWQAETVSARDCTSSPRSITAESVAGFSPFVLDSSSDPTAVDLLSFAATQEAGAVLVTWETATEVDNVGFNLLRSTSADGVYVQLNDTLIPSQSPGAVSGATYTWLDEAVQPGTVYYYKLEAIEVGGASTMHGPTSSSTQNPARLTLTSFEVERGSDALAAIAGALLLAINGLMLVRRKGCCNPN